MNRVPDFSVIHKPVEQPIVVNLSAWKVMAAMIAGPLGFCLYAMLWGAMP